MFLRGREVGIPQALSCVAVSARDEIRCNIGRDGAAAESLLQKIKIILSVISILLELFSV